MDQVIVILAVSLCLLGIALVVVSIKVAYDRITLQRSRKIAKEVFQPIPEINPLNDSGLGDKITEVA